MMVMSRTAWTGAFVLIEQGTNATVVVGMLHPPLESVRPEYSDFDLSPDFGWQVPDLERCPTNVPWIRVSRAGFDPPNWFQLLHREGPRSIRTDGPEPLERTQFIADHGRTISTGNDSPDIGFTWSLNPYRGCEHTAASTAMPGRRMNIWAGVPDGDFESRFW